MREDKFKLFKLYFILNIIIALSMFLNIIVAKRNIDITLIILIICYFSILIIYSILNFRFFNTDASLNLILNIFILISTVILYRINSKVSLKQIVFILIGYIIYLFIMFFVKDIHKFYKFKWIYFILTLIFMSLSLLFGEYINGSKNWISIFGITFQPSEFGKVFFIFYIASIVKSDRDKKNKYSSIFLIIAILSFLIMQRDLGSALIIFSVSIVMYYIMTSKYKFLLFGFITMLVGGKIAYDKFNHVRVRIHAWLYPESDPNGISYQVLQGFFAMGSGGFFGRGLFNGDLDYITLNYTDYIFVSIVEEFGIMMGVLIVILYFLFFIRIFMKIMLIKDKSKSVLLVLGLTTLILLQTMLILGGILNLIPLTGVTLPFISYGGSSIISMFIVFSIIQKVLEEV